MSGEDVPAAAAHRAEPGKWPGEHRGFPETCQACEAVRLEREYRDALARLIEVQERVRLAE